VSIKERAQELAPFKVNLALHVTGKRADGYHTLETLLAFADFGDILTWEPADDLQLCVTGPFADVAPVDDSNLVLRAADALIRARPQARQMGGKLTLEKHVPAGAGLGGGSADAAATLRLLNRVWRLDVSLDELSQIAAPLGADVPACVHNRPAWGRGAGEILSFLPAGKLLSLFVIYPGKALSTKFLFSSHNLLYSSPNQHDMTSSPSLANLSGYRNDLEQTACRIEPLVADLLTDLRALGDTNPDILATGMSGSGSACFALCTTDSAAQHLATVIGHRYSAAWLYNGKIVTPFIQ
jgi:4-diphosphocytidyl-2-C-methyl-D-erythritol kinase